MLHQQTGHSPESLKKKSAQYEHCGVVRGIPDFRAMMARRFLDLTSGEIVAQIHPEKESQSVRKITDLYPLLAEAKQSGEGAGNKKLDIYRRV